MTVVSQRYKRANSQQFYDRINMLHHCNGVNSIVIKINVKHLHIKLLDNNNNLTIFSADFRLSDT